MNKNYFNTFKRIKQKIMQEDYTNIVRVFTKKADSWVNDFIEHTPNLLLALLIFILGFYISRFVKSITIKILRKRKVKPSAKNMLGNIASFLVGVGFLLIALDVLNLDGMLKGLLAGAGVAGLAVGLALQGTLSNTFAGVVLSFREELRIGDQVETNGFVGKIEDINLRMVKLRTPDGNLVTIPNKSILENPIKNYSDKDYSIIILSCGVGYESDLEAVEELVISTVAGVENAPKELEKIIFFYTEFADSSINFEVRFQSFSKSIVETNLMKSKAMKAIKKAFDANNINIPFPIRTLDLPERFFEMRKKESE